MAYIIHVTGKTVTVAQAEKFAAETDNRIEGGFAAGGWFCFKMKSVKNVVVDKALVKKYFKGAYVETATERKVRMDAVVRTKPVALLTTDQHKEIADIIKQQNVGKTASEMCKLVGDANADYCDARGLDHNALDYYAVQKVLVA